MKAAPPQPRQPAAAAVQEGDGRDQERRSREIKISTAWQKAIAFEPLTALIIIIIIIIIIIKSSTSEAPPGEPALEAISPDPPGIRS